MSTQQNTKHDQIKMSIFDIRPTGVDGVKLIYFVISAFDGLLKKRLYSANDWIIIFFRFVFTFIKSKSLFYHKGLNSKRKKKIKQNKINEQVKEEYTFGTRLRLHWFHSMDGKCFFTNGISRRRRRLWLRKNNTPNDWNNSKLRIRFITKIGRNVCLGCGWKS